MRLHRAFTALAALVTLTACEKNAVQDITGPALSTGIRFFNYGINAPQVHFYTGDERLTASNTATCQGAANPPVTAADTVCHTTGVDATTGIAYGSVSSAGNYIGIDPGQQVFSGRITATTDKGTTVSSAPATIAEGRVYSYYQTGFYNTTTKSADAFILEDNMPAGYDYTTAYVRFVNASPNAQPMTLYLTNLATGETITVGGATAYKTGTEFVRVPVAGYNMATRYTGSTQNRILLENIGFEAGGIYTVAARGDMTVTSTTAATRPMLDITVNR